MRAFWSIHPPYGSPCQRYSRPQETVPRTSGGRLSKTAQDGLYLPIGRDARLDDGLIAVDVGLPGHISAGITEIEWPYSITCILATHVELE